MSRAAPMVTFADGELAELLEFAHALATDAAAAILPHFRAPIDVEDKGGARGYDPVTVADRERQTRARHNHESGDEDRRGNHALDRR